MNNFVDDEINADNRSFTSFFIYGTIAIIFLIINYYYWQNENIVSTQKFNNFWAMLSSIGVVAGLIAIVHEYYKNGDEKKYEQRQLFVQQTESNWIELEKYFVSNYPYLTRLYQQMYKDNPTITLPPINFDKKDLHKAKMHEIHVCAILFQIIENVSSFRSYLLPAEFDTWIVTWKSWFRSDIVLEQWKYMKKFYNSYTQNLISWMIISQKNMQYLN